MWFHACTTLTLLRPSPPPSPELFTGSQISRTLSTKFLRSLLVFSNWNLVFTWRHCFSCSPCKWWFFSSAYSWALQVREGADPPQSRPTPLPLASCLLDFSCPPYLYPIYWVHFKTDLECDHFWTMATFTILFQAILISHWSYCNTS